MGNTHPHLGGMLNFRHPDFSAIPAGLQGHLGSEDIRCADRPTEPAPLGQGHGLTGQENPTETMETPWI
jgi:hypothetical protein